QAMRENPLAVRSAGILLHPTSLPGAPALGGLGPEAREFVDFLQAAGQTFWQMLPIHPVGAGDSPYDSPSAFAGATHLISLEELASWGLLSLREVHALPADADPGHADFDRARRERPPLLQRAFATFREHAPAELTRAYDEFLSRNNSWVWDYALFTALKGEAEQRPWPTWSPELRHREPGALEAAHHRLHDAIHYEVFLQFCFQHQWDALHHYARERGVRLMGDIPMFVAHDSVDVWANQRLFFLDAEGARTVQAGVPPDYFSEDGQLWGNPIYRWDTMREEGYGWWIDRLRRELMKFDAVRLDHFIAFARYWEVPIDAVSAKTGRYVPGPSYDFLERAGRDLEGLPLLAEDLGIVTREVELLRDHFALPGMKVLQFAFAPGAEGYLPHRHAANTVVYTGTHDNNTTRGWYDDLVARAETSPEVRTELERVRAFTGVTSADDIAWSLIRSLLASPSHTAIVPVQDILGLDEGYRMNVPGLAQGNWTYRLLPGQLNPQLAERLHALAQVTERTAR
ncbi:MAG TPA: 4-alpha-glucanotransferase, partial [Polyangiaceae bacterium]|nr:4-alpha-glucanotransferase [Polyangiaceae bacterium]